MTQAAKENRRKKWLFRVLKIFFGALIVFLLASYLQKIELAEVLSAIQRADLAMVILSLVALAGIWICRCSILWFVMNLGLPVRWRLAAMATLMGGMMDLLIPGRSGMVVRWGILSLKTKASKGYVLSAVASAVLLEGIVLVLLFLGSFIFAPQVSEFASKNVTVAFEVLLAGLVLCFLVSNWLESQLNKTFLKRISAVPALFEITRRLKNPRNFLMGLGIPTIAWGLQILIVHLLGRAFGLNLSVFEIIILIFAINLAILVPIVPGNVGTIQVVITTVLVRLHYDQTTALAFSFVFHAVQVIPVILTGALVSWLFPVTEGKAIDGKGAQA